MQTSISSLQRKCCVENTDRSCVISFIFQLSFIKSFFPSFLLVVLSFHLSMTTFVLRFELKCNVQMSKCCILMPRAYYSLFFYANSKQSCPQMACTALLCTFVLSPGSRESKIPWMPSKAFCVADICLCVHVRVPAMSERLKGGGESSRERIVR